jgi:hypothetical protein
MAGLPRLASHHADARLSASHRQHEQHVPTPDATVEGSDLHRLLEEGESSAQSGLHTPRALRAVQRRCRLAAGRPSLRARSLVLAVRRRTRVGLGSYFLRSSRASTCASAAISIKRVQHSMQMPTEPFGPRIMTNTGIPHNSFFLLIWHPCSGSASSHSTSRARSSVVRFFLCFLTWGRGRGPRASAVRLTSP